MKNQKLISSSKGIPGSGGRIAKKYLNNIILNMCNSSARYFSEYIKNKKESREHPLAYRERLMYALLSSAAVSISPIALSEMPSDRHYKKTSGHTRKAYQGRIDLWTHLVENNVDIILELKRVKVGAYNTPKKAIPKNIQRAWSSVVGQTDSLTKACISDVDLSKRTISIGILVIFVSKAISGKEPRSPREYMANLIQTLNNIKTKPHYIASWIPPEYMQVIINPATKKKVHNPVITFMAYVKSAFK
jgi:hypothetical protein